MTRLNPIKIKARPAIFLDRDGTLIQSPDPDYKKGSDKILKLVLGAKKALRFFNKLNLPVVLVTNQAWVAGGVISEKNLKELHENLRKKLTKYGARLDAVYFCPHHPEGYLKKYRLVCVCRKPNPGMLKQAARDLNINLKKSVMIGDMTVDILCGRKAGCKTILVKTGHAGLDGKFKVKPHFVAENLLGAVKIIKNKILKV